MPILTRKVWGGGLRRCIPSKLPDDTLGGEALNVLLEIHDSYQYVKGSVKPCSKVELI